MTIRVCIAGATGWTGSQLAKAICRSEESVISGAAARSRQGETLQAILGLDTFMGLDNA